jgi:hypothetical protein
VTSIDLRRFGANNDCLKRSEILYDLSVKPWLALLIILTVALPTTEFARKKLEDELNQHFLKEQIEKEALYLPNRQVIELVAFGYKNLLSDLIWFKTISYFGKHYRSDGRYVWLEHMCQLVTDLNTMRRDTSLFCAYMLSWEAKQPQAAISIITKAIAAQPDDWYLYYNRGFTWMYFLKDGEKAKDDFVKAASLPGASVIVTRLAAKKLAELEGKDAARELLLDALKRAQDNLSREAILSRLRDL